MWRDGLKCDIAKRHQNLKKLNRKICTYLKLRHNVCFIIFCHFFSRSEHPGLVEITDEVLREQRVHEQAGACQRTRAGDRAGM